MITIPEIAQMLQQLFGATAEQPSRESKLYLPGYGQQGASLQRRQQCGFDEGRDQLCRLGRKRLGRISVVGLQVGCTGNFLENVIDVRQLIELDVAIAARLEAIGQQLGVRT